MIKYEKEFDEEFWFDSEQQEWCETTYDPECNNVMDNVKKFIHKCLLRQIDEDNKRFLGMIDGLELLKRNTPNSLKMDIVHSHGELEKMRHNNMFNEAINFVLAELRDKVNKK